MGPFCAWVAGAPAFPVAGTARWPLAEMVLFRTVLAGGFPLGGGTTAAAFPDADARDVLVGGGLALAGGSLPKAVTCAGVSSSSSLLDSSSLLSESS